MENKDLIILIILIIIIGGGLIWEEKNYSLNASPVSIRTDKAEYQKEGILKLVIKNNFGKNICFSSCYPYYLEKKDGGWSLYSYSQCQKPDLSEICLSPRQSKFFEISLAYIGGGLHRLIVPVCLDCKDKENFREDNRFYSNEFLIR